MRNQDDGRHAHPGGAGQQVAKECSNGGGRANSSRAARSKSPYLAPSRQCRPQAVGSSLEAATGCLGGTQAEAAATNSRGSASSSPAPAAYGSGMVQSLIARYGGGGRSRSRSRGECSTAPALVVAEETATTLTTAVPRHSGDCTGVELGNCGGHSHPMVTAVASSGHNWSSGLPRQTTVQNGFGRKGSSSHDVHDEYACPKSPSSKLADPKPAVGGGAAPSLGGHRGFVRPMIVLQGSCDSFCSPTPSPAVDGGHGDAPPSWQQLPVPERSRKSSSGSADSAVCDLNSAAESCDGSVTMMAAVPPQAARGGGFGCDAVEIAAAADQRQTLKQGPAIIGADDDGIGNDGCAATLPSVVVQPGSPASTSVHEDMDVAEDTAAAVRGEVSSNSRGVGDCRTAEQQPQLLLLTVSAGCLQRKVSSDSSICSEMSECSSFNPESMEDEQGVLGSTASFNIGDQQVSWRNAETVQASLSDGGSHHAAMTAAWIQLAGHRGTFLPFRSGTILKKHCSMEEKALRGLMNDPLRQFVPRLFGVVTKDGEKYIEIEDLLAGFCDPSVMDCKIGVRTYLEDELEKALKNPQPRQDMYEKMVKVDPSEPTAEEHQQKGVTKPRYMQWRERVSSSEKLGFRIEAVRQSDGTAVTDFKKTRDRETIVEELLKFTGGKLGTLTAYLRRLTDMRQVMEDSDFLTKHEVIGSSLLFVHDASRAEVWMIDFGKTLPLDRATSVTHRAPWLLGNHEDGYLFGIDNMIGILAETVRLSALASTP